MRVVLATDGSEGARAATDWLTQFPLPPATHIVVMTVVPLPPSALDIPTVRAFHAGLLDAGREAANRARQVLETRWPDVEVRVLDGDPREHLVAAAEDLHADLVVLGARGLGTFKGLLLGSVSSTVARDASCPVLVVKGRTPSPRTILLAVDGSADSLAAARFLASLPLDRSSTVRLLGVVEFRRYPPGPTAILGAYLLAEIEELVQRRKTELTQVLARVAEYFRDAGVAVESSVVVGTASDEIVSAANQPDVGLVVVGARGLGPVKRLLLGSVSERVVHHAGCPVLVVKPSRP